MLKISCTPRCISAYIIGIISFHLGGEEGIPGEDGVAKPARTVRTDAVTGHIEGPGMGHMTMSPYRITCNRSPGRINEAGLRHQHKGIPAMRTRGQFLSASAISSRFPWVDGARLPAYSGPEAPAR